MNEKLDSTMWPDQPLGRDVAGTEQSVTDITREATVDYMQRQYVPNNVVVAVAGAIEHEEVVAFVDNALGSWASGTPSAWFPARDGQDAPRFAMKPKTTEQAHIEIAVQACSSQDPDRFALDLISVILGEGMSSRLFLSVREELGLAYDVGSGISEYADTGSLGIYAGVDPDKLEPALAAILAELIRLRDHDVPPDELAKAKAYLSGGLELRMDDTRHLASWIGGQEALHERVLTLDEALEAVAAVTAADVRRVAGELFREDRLRLAVVAPRGHGLGLDRTLRLPA